MTHYINSKASGVWKDRINERVTVLGYKPNGLAAHVKTTDKAKNQYLPTRWLTALGNNEGEQ